MHALLPTPLAAVDPDIIAVTDLVRTGSALTRQGLARLTGMGRNTVSHLLASAVDAGLIAPDGSAPSTGGRAPAAWRFRHEKGTVLVAGVHTTTLRLAVTDLAGQPLTRCTIDWPITNGPEATLEQAATVLTRMAQEAPTPPWAVGLSLPGPIDHLSGRPVNPPIMPGWDGFDVVAVLQDLLSLPATADNDVNTMLTGYAASRRRSSLRASALLKGSQAPAPQGPVAAPAQPQAREDAVPLDLLYLQVGTGIGASLMAGGRLYRGADGAAGDIGHVRVEGDTLACRCGRTGCLEAVAGGWALLRQARRAAADGLSPHLSSVLDATGMIRLEDVVDGVTHGDTECVTLMVRSATAVGSTLAMLVSFFNPARVVLAGPLPQGCPMFVQVAQRIVSERALDLATESLRIEPATDSLSDELRGCTALALDSVFARATG